MCVCVRRRRYTMQHETAVKRAAGKLLFAKIRTLLARSSDPGSGLMNENLAAQPSSANPEGFQRSRGELNPRFGVCAEVAAVFAFANWQVIITIRDKTVRGRPPRTKDSPSPVVFIYSTEISPFPQLIRRTRRILGGRDANEHT